MVQRVIIEGTKSNIDLLNKYGFRMRSGSKIESDYTYLVLLFTNGFLNGETSSLSCVKYTQSPYRLDTEDEIRFFLSNCSNPDLWLQKVAKTHILDLSYFRLLISIYQYENVYFDTF